MKNIEPFTDRTLIAEQPGRDIDALLRDFFQRQLPDPWPGPPTAKEKSRPVLLPMRPVRRHTQTRRYLSLAAALAVFVLGYWALGKVFPTALPDIDFLKSQNTIVNNPATPKFDMNSNGVDLPNPGQHNIPEKVQTPKGEYQVYEQQVNGKTYIRVEALPKVHAPSGQ